MKKQFVRQTLIIALIAIWGFAYSQDAVMLKYNFVKGKTYVQSSQISQNVTQSMGGREMKILGELKSTNEYAVEGVENNGNATVLISVPEISIHSVAMGKDTTMIFKDLKDKSRVVYSFTGKSLSTAKVDSSESAKIVDQMSLGKIRTLPGKSVTVGEKWQDQTTENRKTSGNPFVTGNTSDIEYTLVGKEAKDGKEYFKISFSGTLTITGKGTQMGMEMYIEGTGKTEGFYYFDPKISLVVYSEDNTELDMNVAISGQQNMTIPMNQTIKNIVKFEEKKQ
jgi:hypothetical protein